MTVRLRIVQPLHESSTVYAARVVFPDALSAAAMILVLRAITILPLYIRVTRCTSLFAEAVRVGSETFTTANAPVLPPDGCDLPDDGEVSQ